MVMRDEESWDIQSVQAYTMTIASEKIDIIYCCRGRRRGGACQAADLHC